LIEAIRRTYVLTSLKTFTKPLEVW